MRSLPGLFGSLQKIFIEPPLHIQDVEIRHKSRLLNVFLLPMIVVFLGVDGVYLATLPGYRPPWYGYIFLLAAYILNRSRFYRMAAFLTLAMFPAVILVNIVSGSASNPISTIYYLVPGLILAGILLSLRATAFFALMEIAVIASMPFIAPDRFPRINMIVGPVSTLAISAVLVLASMWFRNQVEKDRQELVRHTEEKYRNIFENAIDGIFQSTTDGRFVSVNLAMARMYGYDSPEEMVQKVTNIASQLYVEPELRNVLRRRLTEGEKITGFEMHQYRKDKSTLWTSLNVQAIRDVDGNILYYEGTVEDITSRKQVEAQRRQAEAALRESEERFRKIFYSSPIAICITTIDEGRLLNANQAYWEITGYSSETSIGQNAEELKMWDNPQERVEFVHELREKHSISDADDYFYHTDGSLKNVMSFYELIQIGDQKCILSMFHDMSTQKQLETERENLIRQLGAQNAESETLREGLASILGTFEFSEIVQHILDQIHRVVPYDSASIWRLERNIQKFISGRNLPDMFAGGEVQFELDETSSAIPILMGKVPYILNNNVQEELLDFNEPPHTYVNSWLAIPLKMRGRIIGLIALDGKRKDQFNEHHAELAVTFANQVAIALENSRLFTELQNELFVREKLIKELESKNVELERFTYTVSHDLKSPLVTINGFLGYLERDAEMGNMERLKNDTRRIQDAVNRMHRLLSELLELSRIGRLMNQPEEIPFDDLVREVLDIVHGRLEARRISVQTQSNLSIIHGDRQRLTEVLQNVIDNAAKFMGEQIDPRIEIGQRGEEDGKPVFFVRDNGIGIAPEYHERIFGLFDKLDTKSDGTGIGLALVKRIVEVHGGRIWVESMVGSGATFYFTLPCNRDVSP